VLVRELQSLCLDVELINRKSAGNGSATEEGVGEALIATGVEG